MDEPNNPRVEKELKLSEITHTSSNCNDTEVEVWEWISNYIPHFTGFAITYPRWNQSTLLVKGPLAATAHFTATHLKIGWELISYTDTQISNELQWVE